MTDATEKERHVAIRRTPSMGGRLKTQERWNENEIKILNENDSAKNFTVNGVLFKERTGNAHVNLLNRAAATSMHEGLTASSLYDRWY